MKASFGGLFGIQIERSDKVLPAAVLPSPVTSRSDLQDAL